MSPRHSHRLRLTFPSLPPLQIPFLAPQHLILIRHGESEYNRAIEQGSGFKDPMIFDPPLTRKGREQVRHALRPGTFPLAPSKPPFSLPHLSLPPRSPPAPHAHPLFQARGLREKLRAELSMFGDALWVVSPLRRAIETFMLACPSLSDLHGAAPGSNAAGEQATSQLSAQLSKLNVRARACVPVARKDPKGVRSPVAIACHACSSMRACMHPSSLSLPLPCNSMQLPMQVEVVPTISEFLITAGDVGSNPQHLAREFPSLSKQIEKLPEKWWFQEPKKPNCAEQKVINSREPKAHQLVREGAGEGAQRMQQERGDA
jgi:hypothetical protein